MLYLSMPSTHRYEGPASAAPASVANGVEGSTCYFVEGVFLGAVQATFFKTTSVWLVCRHLQASVSRDDHP